MKLEDERAETPFAVRDNALDMRIQITELSFRQFGKKPRKLPKEPSNWSEWSEKSQQDWLQKQEVKRQQAELFDGWFVMNERTILDRICRNIVFNIDKANAIKPQFIFECDEQRKLTDEAIGLCSNLKRELNYIMDVLPSNKNFITQTMGIIEKEIYLLRKWRTWCNKYREKVKE